MALGSPRLWLRSYRLKSKMALKTSSWALMENLRKSFMQQDQLMKNWAGISDEEGKGQTQDCAEFKEFVESCAEKEMKAKEEIAAELFMWRLPVLAKIFQFAQILRDLVMECNPCMELSIKSPG